MLFSPAIIGKDIEFEAAPCPIFFCDQKENLKGNNFLIL